MTMSDYNINGLQGAARTHNSFLQSKANLLYAYSSFGTSSLGFYRKGGTTMRVTSAYQSGSFVNIPKTKTVSMRAHMRLLDTAGTGSVTHNCAVAMMHRAEPQGSSSLIIGGSATYMNSGGYSLHMGGNYAAGTTTVLRFVYRGPNDNWALHADTITSLYLNSWYTLRMDIIPSGSISDTINVYYVSGDDDTGSEIWTLLFTKTLLSTDPGYQSSPNHTSNGINAYSNGTNAAFIDNYSITITDTV